MKKLTKRGECLVLKVVGPNGESHNGFIWPLEVGAVVEAPDWKPTVACGNGLHGWLWGLGSLTAARGRAGAGDSVWMALAVAAADVVDLDGKVKFPRCRIVAVADKTTIANIIAAHRPANTPVPFFGQAAAGYAGQAAAGSRGQAAAGSMGQAAVEADGLATCGIGGLVKGGANAVLVAMYSTGQTRSDFGYSVGQVGRAGIEAETWYEGSADGLRRVADDDVRVKQWTAAWALFDERKAAREALAAKANEARQKSEQ